METNGWVKLHRKILKWQWYTDIPCRILFEHLLFTVNHKPNKWLKYNIEAGQKITSLGKLALETGLSLRQVRTALDKLKSTGELTCRSDNKFTLITIVNYTQYQIDDRQSDNQVTSQRQTDDKPATTNNNEKNIKNDKKADAPAQEEMKLFDFCLEGFSEEDRATFAKAPEESLPDSFGDEWIARKGKYDEKLWIEWTKFYRFYTSPDTKYPLRRDWITLWINWITN